MAEPKPILRRMIRAAKVFYGAGLKFHEIDGSSRAASFSYYAFFALFPLILLFITIGSLFLNQEDVARHVVRNIELYLPLGGSDKTAVEDTIRGVLVARKEASLLAVLALVWSASQLFHALVRGVNRAWGTIEYPWWQVPIQSLVMLGLVASALFIGIVVPVIIRSLRHTVLFDGQEFRGLFQLAALSVPSLVLFYGLSMFYKLVPRRRTRFSEVILAALITTILLQVCRLLFEIYVADFGNFNAVYGAFAAIVVLLMWIYLSGVLIIFGGCLCAAGNTVVGNDGKTSAEDVMPRE